MPLFAIRRSVGLMSSEEMDAAVYRAIFCAVEYPDLRWIRSFWDTATGEVCCYYEALGPEQIREHSRRSAIPCDSIAEVTELVPEGYGESERAPAAPVLSS